MKTNINKDHINNSKPISFYSKYLDILFSQANKAIKSNSGGPFSAIILKDNKIISQAYNKVIKKNDPTAHAEIEAIRKACKKEHSFFLKDCVLISICEPCPMCLSAIIWARIPKVYYLFSRKEAEDIGFNDNKIYKYLENKKNNIDLTLQKIPIHKISDSKNPFKIWKNKKNKIQY